MDSSDRLEEGEKEGGKKAEEEQNFSYTASAGRLRGCDLCDTLLALEQA